MSAWAKLIDLPTIQGHQISMRFRNPTSQTIRLEAELWCVTVEVAT
jgi:hypothetical protein